MRTCSLWIPPLFIACAFLGCSQEHHHVGSGYATSTNPLAVFVTFFKSISWKKEITLGDIADPDAKLQAFLEVAGLRYPALAVSATTGQGLGQIGPWLFAHLDIVRVYTKAPGRPPARDRPYTMRRGQTAADVAELVHKDLARSLRYARVWSKGGFDGQHVGRTYSVADGDVIELHA